MNSKLELFFNKLYLACVNFINANTLDPLDPYPTNYAKNHSGLQDLAKNYETIRKEITANRQLLTPLDTEKFFEDLSKDKKWKKYYLKWYRPILKQAKKDFPETTKILSKYSDIKLAMFSCMDPRSSIPPHFGPWPGSIRAHVGIDTPNNDNCFIEINPGAASYRYSWRNGETVAFNDTYFHSVVNNTDQHRIVLFLDIERKMKTKTAQFVLGFLNFLAGIIDGNRKNY